MDLSIAVCYVIHLVMWVDETEGGTIPVGIRKTERIHDNIVGEREK